MRAAVITTCHDRRELTVRALRTVQAAAAAAGVPVSFTLYDDGSTDGTAQAVAALPFRVDRIDGSGTAFWARGMAVAERRALLQDPEADHLLWLNDDVALDEDAVARLRAVAEQRPGAIVSGAVREADGRVSYGGYRRSGRHPLRLRPVLPGTAPEPVDAVNGNLLLVPRAVAERLGGIDGGFAHQLADIDYGFRAAGAGVPVLLAPGTFGVCPSNPPAPSRGARADWAAYLSPKGGGHAGSMRRVLKRNARWTWPAWMGQTYLLWWVRAARRSLRRRFLG